MTRREIMTRMRSQVLLVKRLDEQLRELSPDGIRSLRIGGVTGNGNAMRRGLDVQIEKREAIERMLARENARLGEYEAAARREMIDMKPGMYAFCVMYYIGGFSVEECSKAIDRSLRHCMRYKHEIEAA